MESPKVQKVSHWLSKIIFHQPRFPWNNPGSHFPKPDKLPKSGSQQNVWGCYIIRPDIYTQYIPGTQMTSIFEGQPPKTRPFPIKTMVIWVPGIYIEYIHTKLTWPIKWHITWCIIHWFLFLIFGSNGSPSHLMVNWWFGILGVPLSNNPFHFRGSQESKPPTRPQTTNYPIPRPSKSRKTKVLHR